MMFVSTPRCAYREDSSLHPSSSRVPQRAELSRLPGRAEHGVSAPAELSGLSGSRAESDLTSSSAQNSILFTPPIYVPS
ncbi:hypothetical protein ACRRTK_012439 [Alexandromys fortis]